MTNGSTWRRIEGHRLRRWSKILGHFADRLIPLLAIPAPDTPQLLRRIVLMERDVILPVKAAGVAMLLYSFYFSRWIQNILTALDIAVDSTLYLFWVYVGLNLVVAGVLINVRKLPLGLVQWVIFAISLVDGIFLSSLTLITGGYDSILYWLFLGLIVRSSVSVPRATSQLLLNLTLSACYVLAGVLDIAIAENLDLAETLYRGVRESSGLSRPLDNPAEPLFLRLMLLLLMTVCSYGVQVLLERQRKAEEEAREFAVREGQLRSAGRLAAEFTHQMKNPLAIINNAAYSLQRALKDGRPPSPEQVRIIQEEVEHSDRIITQIMGYAQLSEGRVEKLNVIEEIEEAIRQVFPPGLAFPVKLHRSYGEAFPPLLMQRRHLSDTFINLLQNAREALGEQGGNIWVTAASHGPNSIEVCIRDDGPGIPPDKHGRVFEAYYTTKPKGTGLGLASVKHNIELYGGTVKLESELGKGARFVLLFPARSLMNVEG